MNESITGEIYSKVEPNKLLHIITRLDSISEVRQNISPDEQYLQVSAFKMPEGKTFPPHKHLPVDRRQLITQESWVIIKGRVKAFLYDLDDQLIATPILEAGDCSITFYGGHTYECLEEGTVVYEYKTGPYEGQSADKVFI